MKRYEALAQEIGESIASGAFRLGDRWWLFLLAMLPAGFGTLLGDAGLAAWHLHPSGLIKLLS
jgi:hypothetical protein